MGSFHRIWLTAGASALVLAAASTVPARAADTAASNIVPEVIVTATRRSENLKAVPISATALSGGPLQVLGTAGQDIRQLAFKVPSLNIESSNGRTFPRFYIRGYGNTDFNSFASQPVSLIYDDVVQENAALKGFPVFDEADVEVLRGPQGTLFGRNTPAGVVKFESAKPKLGFFGGYYKVSDGTYNTGNVEGAVNIPVSDKLALRASVQEQHRDNWVTDPINNGHLEGYDDWAARLQLLYQPTSDFTALFNVHGRALRGSARLFRANIFTPGTNSLMPGFDPSKFYADGDNVQTFGSLGANMHLTWKKGDVTYYSITGYETILHYFTKGDIDGGNFGGPGIIFFPVETAGGIKRHNQFTQEFRAASSYGGPVNWQAGAFFFYEDVLAPGYDYNNTGQIFVDETDSRQRNDAEAIFGSVDYKITPDLKLTAGLRYTADHKRFDIAYSTDAFGAPLPFVAPFSQKAGASRINWDVSGVYTVNPDVNLYARVATSFRAPSFGAPAPVGFSPAKQIQVAKAEDVISYETGVKADMFDHKARLSFDVFYYDVDNQQLTEVGGGGNNTFLMNAKRTIGQGAELEFEVHPIKNLTFNLSGSYNDTKIEDPNFVVSPCAQCTLINPVVGGVIHINGNPLPQAAKWIGDFSMNYTYPVGPDSEVYLYTDWAYRSGVNFFLYEAKEFDSPELLEGGIRLGYKWDHSKYDVAVYCRNCTDQIVAIGGIDFDDNTGMINDPRIIGVQFGGKF